MAVRFKLQRIDLPRNAIVDVEGPEGFELDGWAAPHASPESTGSHGHIPAIDPSAVILWRRFEEPPGPMPEPPTGELPARPRGKRK